MKHSLMTLEEYRKSHPMDLDTVIQIGLDICKSLESGLPHGDINAAGICVTDNWEFVFDDAKEKREPDMAADSYALGMLLYRLLNKGRLPFVPPYPEKVTKAEKETAIERCLSGELFPIPVEGTVQITEVLQKACHVDRMMRFQNPTEMGMALAAAAMPVQKEEEPQLLEVEQEVSPIRLEEEEELEVQPKRRRNKKEKKEKSSALGKFQILFVLLSAVLSGVYIFMTKQICVAESSKLIQIGFSVAQVVLLVFATKSKIFLKMLGALVLADGFCVITADLFLVRVLDGMGRELPRFYAPGYMVVVLPIVIAVFYLFGCLMRERIGHIKNKFFAVVMALTSLFALLLSITGINRMALTVDMYPYATGVVVMVFAVLAMENKFSGIGVRVLSFLNICMTICLMLVYGYAQQVQAFGIPGRLVEKVLIAVTILFSVIIFSISGRRSDDEDDEEEND